MKLIYCLVLMCSISLNSKAQSAIKNSVLIGEWKLISLRDELGSFEYDVEKKKFYMSTSLLLAFGESDAAYFEKKIIKEAENSFFKVKANGSYELALEEGSPEKGTWKSQAIDESEEGYIPETFGSLVLTSDEEDFEVLIIIKGQQLHIVVGVNTSSFDQEYVFRKNFTGNAFNNDVKQPVVSKAKTSTDIKLEKWVTEPVAYFESIGSFKDGLAKVSRGGSWVTNFQDTKWGYINTDGKIVVPLKYDEAMDFSNGLASVTLNNKTGFINRMGKVVIPLTWDYAGPFSEGLAVVEKNDKRGCIDTTGKIVLAPKFDNLHKFNEGLISFEDKNHKWGFLDRTGKIIIQPKYSSPSLGDLGVFKDGICMMQMWNAASKSFKYGFLNKEGKEVIGLIYDDAKAFSEGLACVKMDKQYGYINKEGKVIIPFEYDYAYSFENGLAQIKENETYGIINKKGEFVTPIRYLSITSFTEGITIVRRKDLTYGFINEAGKEIITVKYDEAGAPKNGLIAVSKNGKWGFIDLEGNTKIPFIYDKAYGFIGGLAEVVLNGKPLIIDRSGNKWIAAKK